MTDEQKISELESLAAKGSSMTEAEVNRFRDIVPMYLPRLLTLSRVGLAAEGLAKALQAMRGWALEVSDEKIDGEVARMKYVKDLDEARTTIASYIEGRAALDETVREG